ncbi:MAG: M81 family metallopeptidase [Erysipelotrichaceae bacterium]|nr:M81 family metallopeptidase [Erysipelotrichaceae bacterium]
MKILVGFFTTESNEHVPLRNDITVYDIAFGDECIRKSKVDDVLAEEGVEGIGAIYANAGSSGVIKRNTFDYIESCMLETVREHLNEIDGIWLHLHGASEVEGLGSGDHHILWEVRKVVGPYVPIVVCCDPHGNLCKEYVEATQICRSYRESPHTDMEPSKKLTMKMLIELCRNRQNIHAVYRKLPLILGGEQSVSTDEPVKTINKYMDEMEKDPRILSASWHVGYIRHDSEVAGCGIVVTPATADDQQYAEEKADELAEYVWNKRHEFHYTGLTAQPDEALKMTLEFAGGPCVITDSGDNATSGAMSWNTYVLRQVLAVKDLKKSFLFAAINDPATYDQLLPLNEGDKAEINLGVGHDEMSEPVALKVTVKKKAQMAVDYTFGEVPDITIVGETILVNIDSTPIDVIVQNQAHSYMSQFQFEYAGVDPADYDVTVVKQGYIFPYLKSIAAFYVMSLTNGPTLQDTAHLPFKKVMRPMFPIDNI